jgi:putative transcriptional regulator
MRNDDISPGGAVTESRSGKYHSENPSNDPEDYTDWARVVAMTEDKAYRNALADEDSQPMTRAQLAGMRRSPNPREIRRQLGMTQEQFARQFQIALGTLRDWEQGLHLPDSTAKAYLRLIERAPDLVALVIQTDDAVIARMQFQVNVVERNTADSLPLGEAAAVEES